MVRISVYYEYQTNRDIEHIIRIEDGCSLMDEIDKIFTKGICLDILDSSNYKEIIFIPPSKINRIAVSAAATKEHEKTVKNSKKR